MSFEPYFVCNSISSKWLSEKYKQRICDQTSCVFIGNGVRILDSETSKIVKFKIAD